MIKKAFSGNKNIFIPYFSCSYTHGRMWVYGREDATPLTFDKSELKQRRRRSQRERQKSNRFRQAKQLCTCITLFCTFLCRYCTTTTRKCLISLFAEDVNPRQRRSLSFPDLSYSVLALTPEIVAKIWRIGRDGISATKFKASGLHFLSDVFVAVTAVVA